MASDHDISTYLANEILDHIFGEGARDFTSPATLFVSAHDGDPGTTGANEVSGGSYARQAVDFTVAAGGLVENTALIEFTDMPPVTVSYMGVWDAVSAGNFLWRFEAATATVISSGGTLQVPAGSLEATLP